jgi:hypothetical protein
LGKGTEVILNSEGQEDKPERSDAQIASQKKAVMVRKQNAEMRRAIKKLLSSTEMEALQERLMENWAELLLSDDPQIFAFATKEVSKYVFSVKKDHQGLPDVTIACEFRGIKDNKTVAVLEDKISELQDMVIKLESELKEYKTDV